MPTSSISSRDFNQDSGRAKRAAAVGPVFVTDRGRPSLVVLSIEDYWKLIQVKATIVDLLAMPEMAAVSFETFESAGPAENA